MDTEQAISQIGAKVANAAALLIQVQKELEELYLSIGEVPPKP